MPTVDDPRTVAALEAAECAVWRDLYERAERSSPASGIQCVRRGNIVLTVFPHADVLAFNRAFGVGLTRPATSVDLDAIVDTFRRAGCARCMVPIVPTAAPADVGMLLDAHGFYHHNNWVRLSRDAGSPPDAPTDLRTGALDPAHTQAFADLVVAAFEWPAVFRAMFADSVGSPGWTHVGAWDGDELVAVGGMFVHGTVAWLGPAATRPEARGRGAQTALIAARLRAGLAHGVDLFTVETAEPAVDKDVPSHRNLVRMGFQVSYVRPNWVTKLTSEGAGRDT